MKLTPAGHIERALPPIFTTETERAENPTWKLYNTERISWYTSLVVDSGLVRGGWRVIPEFVAAMIMESGLDNLTVGNNAKNGADNPWVGVGWCQLDTGYHVTDLEALHTLRADPHESLRYVTSTPDLCKHGKLQTYFNKQRWHAWEPEVIDPDDGWSPLQAAFNVWDAS